MKKSERKVIQSCGRSQRKHPKCFEQYPVNVDVAYVYYLKALAYYMLISNVNHDQSRTSLAKDSFEDVMAKFPYTKYAIDSCLKIVKIKSSRTVLSSGKNGRTRASMRMGNILKWTTVEFNKNAK
ncbi:outer membrane protein assembly factor BamD [Trichonephila clavipes]|nr:outer membrane protein assembly factor BamD [Trichonephila clavipes]